MGTRSLEAVLVGGPLDGDGQSVGIDVRVRSLRDGTDVFRLRSNFFLASRFVHVCFVLTSEAVNNVIDSQFDSQE